MNSEACVSRPTEPVIIRHKEHVDYNLVNFHEGNLNMTRNTYDKYNPYNSFSVKENEVWLRAPYSFDLDLSYVV